MPVRFRVSERRGCQVIRVQRSTTRDRSLASDQAGLRVRLRDLAAVRVRSGDRGWRLLLCREG